MGPQAPPALTPTAVARLDAFGLTTQDLERLIGFFASAFGAQEIRRERFSGLRFEQLMLVSGGAVGVTLSLGVSRIEVLMFEQSGNVYPPAFSAADPLFQHFAIVVEDMDAAYRRLAATPGWSAISTCGPVQLPESSGAVRAFKFKDPDGHPLELLSFPKDRIPAYWQDQPYGPCLGIDHSAIACRSIEASVEFYGRLGLRVTSRTFNQGIEQQSLDGIPDAQADVIALTAADPCPHVELLCYRGRPSGPLKAIRNNDLRATRLIFANNDAQRIPDVLLRDPDGHHILIR
jgi:catechol 2,3-dioxygenase-like lactoylglutathione lyase family enzyme